MWVLRGQTFLTLNAGYLLNHSSLIWKNNTACTGFWLGQRKYLPTAGTVYQDVTVKSNIPSTYAIAWHSVHCRLLSCSAGPLTFLCLCWLLLNLEQNSFPNFMADIWNGFPPWGWKKQLSINIADFTFRCFLFNSQSIINSTAFLLSCFCAAIFI